MAQLRPEIPQIRQLGAELIVVGNGNTRYAAAFREDLKLDAPLYVDPELAAYSAAGLKRGVWRTLGPGVWGHGLRALRNGFRQKNLQGDPWQEGGVFVIMPNGKVPYMFISEVAGDHPPTKDIIDALQAAVKSHKS